MNFKKDKKGITLMETIIALGVLVTGILSVITLSTSSINLSSESESQIVVTNLAREGLEIIKQTRDYSKSGYALEVFADENYRFFDNDSLSSTTALPDGCYIVDSETDGNFGLKTLATNVNCSGDSFETSGCGNCELYEDSSSGLFSHDSSGIDTIYNRVVKVKSESSTEKRIFSKVMWAEKGKNHEIILESVLTDW